MIKKSLKRAFLSDTVLGTTCYIGLASSVTENADGTVQVNEVPAKDPVSGGPTNYHRYELRRSGNNANLAMSTTEAEAHNTGTCFFDVADNDWNTDVRYFVIYSDLTSNNTTYVRAWGKIVDEFGNPTVMNIKKNQLPIIRANTLSMALTEVDRAMYTLTFEMNGHGTKRIPDMSQLYCYPALNLSLEEYTPDTFRPTEEGYIFEGWYTDPTFQNLAVARTDLPGNTTVYAKWVKDVNAEGGETTEENIPEVTDPDSTDDNDDSSENVQEVQLF